MARKLSEEELFNEESASAPSASENDADGSGTNKPQKRKVVVANVPKQKNPLSTPSHIIRITMIWCFLIFLFLLTSPFLQVTFYITEDMEVTPYIEKAYTTLATQEEIDACTKELKAALDGLEEAPIEEDPDADQKTENSDDASSAASSAAASEPSQTSQSAGSTGGVRGLDSVYYNWTYYIAEGINSEELEELISECKNINRDIYTEESLEKLNEAMLKAQKSLCASVFVSQNALQMMLGGSVGEAFGSAISLTDTFLRGCLPLLSAFCR